MAKVYYEVLTWDVRKEDFTPQIGVRRGPWSKWGLRRALRKLNRCGYDTDRHNAPSVLVLRRESTRNGKLKMDKAQQTSPSEH
jgi:hypothetical protein